MKVLHPPRPLFRRASSPRTTTTTTAATTRTAGATIGTLCPLLLILVLVLPLPSNVVSLSAEVARLHRAQLQQALSSPSGKLTYSPEILVPEPRDPTAILLQAPAITQLSSNIRNRAKANIAFISSDALGSFRTFCKEQEEARGNFPGPVPVVYCGTENAGAGDAGDGDASDAGDGMPLEAKDIDMAEVAETGVSGILVSVNGGSEISSFDDIDGDASWLKICNNALDCGLQPIPEIVVKDTTASTWKEEDTEALVEKLSELLGEDPVSIVITINTSEVVGSDDSDKQEEEEQEEESKATTTSSSNSSSDDLPLPSISKALGKRVSIMASVRTGAGGGRLGETTRRIKASGFTGAFLRRECLPGFPANPSIEFSSDFWSACIGDLKSTRSKTFNFRSKNNMELQVGTQWANLQQDVMDSGALGDMSDGPPPGFDADEGDYQGF
eukprot:CAMPEP_0172389884 /NCGR_PEP_ID=MMETSP1061-20121228/6661_1 /TAXON_ID=37318 /ORGANISM="Pseudo-nitzschia pungens, Strain cf. pungens" /LENGTH=442 /DNA_ID=CAMNT_0013120123 /DNA_START=196 /DNA_END=1524 /DNA_ORIENTATION=+